MLVYMPPMYSQLLRYSTIGVLLVIIIVSWGYAGLIWRVNADQIVINLSRIAHEAALPYRIARLSMQSPADELPVPVYGVQLSEIGDTWGAARSQGRTHEGVDIYAERGTPVFSATNGYVVRRNIGDRGGKNVMVIGPGGHYYYYAHLDRIAEEIHRGSSVNTDTVLGFVGNTGNATQTPPHLHLGVYHDRWDAQNPYPLLVDRWAE